MERFENNPFIL